MLEKGGVPDVFDGFMRMKIAPPWPVHTLLFSEWTIVDTAVKGMTAGPRVCNFCLVSFHETGKGLAEDRTLKVDPRTFAVDNLHAVTRSHRIGDERREDDKRELLAGHVEEVDLFDEVRLRRSRHPEKNLVVEPFGADRRVDVGVDCRRRRLKVARDAVADRSVFLLDPTY
jgi:hypothetical protein